MGDIRTVSLAVAAYDAAITLLAALPPPLPDPIRNNLGAALLNRGHALLAIKNFSAATDSFTDAIVQLSSLPLGENPAYRLNLTGAHTNLAHALLSHHERVAPSFLSSGLPTLNPHHSTLNSASSAARTALVLVARLAPADIAFAEMDLRARRALITALGHQLVAAEASGQSTDSLAAEVSDLLDDGLALARTWETRGTPHLRPLALRLFTLGAQFYRVHQSHFLAEFLLENLDPAAPSDSAPAAPFAADPQFRAVATDALAQALAACSTPRHLTIGDPASEHHLATARSLRAARATLFPEPA